MIRVMIVDDEPLILDGLTYLLDWETLGFEVVAKARNGREALELSRTIAFDVLITDIKMRPWMEPISMYTHGTESCTSSTIVEHTPPKPG